jgi:hypothetical protein
MVKKYITLFKNRQNFLLNQKAKIYSDRKQSLKLLGEPLVFSPLIDKRAASLKRNEPIQDRLNGFTKTYQTRREEMRQSKELQIIKELGSSFNPDLSLTKPKK